MPSGKLNQVNIHFIVEGTTYPYPLFFSIQSDADFKKSISRYAGVATEYKDDEDTIWKIGNCAGCFRMFDSGKMALRLSDIPNCPTTTAYLVHELFHCVSATLKRVGIKLSPESEEAYAYLLDWYIETILKKIKYINLAKRKRRIQSKKQAK